MTRRTFVQAVVALVGGAAAVFRRASRGGETAPACRACGRQAPLYGIRARVSTEPGYVTYRRRGGIEHRAVEFFEFDVATATPGAALHPVGLRPVEARHGVLWRPQYLCSDCLQAVRRINVEKPVEQIHPDAVYQAFEREFAKL